MEKKFTFQNALLFALLLIGIYKFSFLSAEKSTKSITMTGDTLGFINYVTAPGWVDTSPGNFWNITNQFDSYKELNYNTSQMFVSESDSLGYFNQDVLSPEQKTRLQTIASLSNQAGLNCYLERVRISALCYSQRLIYEAEGGNYGFSYQRRTANIETDGDRTVVHACRNTAECPQADATPRMLCDSIYENLQHTDLYYFWPGSTDNLRWKIKPVMKIDSNDFSPFDTTEVVAIITKNYFGNTIDSTIIRVENFKNDNNQYFGQYIDKYNLIPLIVNGHTDSSNSLSYNRPAPGKDIKACKVDFKVYWFGKVDMWFDKMIVDDERADKLFNLDTNQNYDIKIRDEVSTLGNSVIYYVDELTSSQASTTKYVRDKMRFYNSNVTMQFALSNNLNIYSHRDPATRNKMLFDTIQPDIVCLDDHVFLCNEDNLIYLPNNTTGYDLKVPEHWKKSPSEYNTRLQTMAFGNKSEIETSFQGTFIYQITKIRNDLRQLSPDTKFTVQPHLHSWTMTVENEQYYKDNGFREPTNQEIQATGMIAIAHGTQGLSWVNYQSNSSSNINAIHDTLVTPNDTSFTIFGLRNDDQNHTKRTSNIIHQDKWEYVKAMNLKILH